MRVSAAVVAVLLVAPMAVLGAGASTISTTSTDTDCATVPCGYISPIIIIDLDRNDVELSPDRSEVEIPGTVTYKWDVDQEGFGAWEPDDPPEVTLRFTRKPDWVSASVDPVRFPVEMSPEHLSVDDSNPTQPDSTYSYTQPITVTLAKQEGQPIVAEEGFEEASMGLYARSSESGLYKPGYGFREIRVAPDGYDVVTDRSKVDAVFSSVALDTRTSDDLIVPFHNVNLDMDLLSDVQLWKPTQMAFKVADAQSGETLPHPDFWATIVDEEGEILYQTGFRHPHDGVLNLNYSFPDVGRYNVLVGARPTPQLTQQFWQPVTASFPVVVERSGSPSYPSSYHAHQYESLQTFAGDPGSEHQFQKTIPFPVRDGATEGTLHAQLDGRAYFSPQQPPSGPAEVTVEVLSPSDKSLAKQTLTPDAPSAELSFDLSSADQHRIRITGTSVHPVDYGVGAVMDWHLRVDYDDPPTITKDNVDHPEPGLRTVENGQVTFDLEGADDLEPWAKADLKASVDAPGELRELTVTVVEDGGTIHHTADIVESTKSTTVEFPFPRAGRYLVVVTAEPLPGTGASWQTQSAAFPVLVGDPGAEKITYPTRYEAGYEETVTQVQGDTQTATDQHDRYFRFPVLGSASSIEATVSLADGATGQFEVELLNENGTQVASADLGPANPSVTVSPDRIRPQDHVVHVSGTGNPGAGYTVSLGVGYDEAPVTSNPLETIDETIDDLEEGSGGLLPGFEAVAVLGAVGLAAVVFRKHR